VTTIRTVESDGFYFFIFVEIISLRHFENLGHFSFLKGKNFTSLKSSGSYKNDRKYS
jgi:hypothetical protein